MQSSRACFSVFTLSAAMAFAAATMAADLPKEGTYSGTYSAFGTAKVTSIGKERVLLTISDENGMSLTNGFGDHVTWHCWGLGDYTNRVGQDSGYCVATDPSGDQFVDNWSDTKHELGGKVKGTDVFGSGTRKYTGITGVERLRLMGESSRCLTAPMPFTAPYRAVTNYLHLPNNA